MKNKIFIDLFCGCGGMSLGFEMAGWECALAVDFNKYAVNYYNLNRDNQSAVLSDLSKLKNTQDILSFLSENNVNYKKITAIIGGPPCQGFSSIGKLNQNQKYDIDTDPRNKLVSNFIKFINAVEPEIFVMENVPTPHSIAYIKNVVNDKLRKKYKISYNVLNAVNYGVPQIRKRLFVVGTKGGKEWEPPKGITTDTHITLDEAISDLPPLRHGEVMNQSPYTKSPQNKFQENLRRNAKLLFNHICAEIQNEDNLKFFQMMKAGWRTTKRHRQEMLSLLEKTPNISKKVRYCVENGINNIRKLAPNKPSPTITTQINMLFIHYSQPRYLSTREIARIQTFPDDFIFPVIENKKAAMLIGNSVPVFLAREIAKSLI